MNLRNKYNINTSENKTPRPVGQKYLNSKIKERSSLFQSDTWLCNNGNRK